MKSRIRQIDRRRFVAGSAAVAGAAVLGARAARAQGTPVASPAPVVPPVANTEVSGEVRYSLVVNQPTDVAQSQELFDTAFREQYPNVTVTVEPAPQGGSGGDPLLAQMVAGDAPDILDTWASRALPYADAGQILDLEPLIQRDFTPDALADFYPGRSRRRSSPAVCAGACRATSTSRSSSTTRTCSTRRASRPRMRPWTTTPTAR